MKIILILMLLFASIADAKNCRLPIKSDNSSILSIIKPNKNIGYEIPRGKCKLVKPEFMKEHSFGCEDALAVMSEINPRLAKKYDCYQPARGKSRHFDNGVPVSSIFAICYICQTPKEDK